MAEICLEMKGISKHFPGVRALDGVDLTAERGEIHALVGENGAGKTTLMRILAAVYPSGSYEGEMIIDGQLQEFRSVLDAEQAGVVMIPQILQVVPELTVGENVYLNREPTRYGVIQWEELYRNTEDLLSKFMIDAVPRGRMNALPVSKQQLVVIATAFSKKARIMILDEPTSSLTESETGLLFDSIRALKREGVTCIYISHRIQEVLQIADRVTVLRDGRLVGTEKIADLSHSRIVSMMVGREIKEMYPKVAHTIGEVALEARNLVARDPDVPGKVVVRDVSFQLRKGEILGLFGLVGSGRTEMVNAIFGTWTGRSSGELLIGGNPTSISTPQEAIALGMGLLTEDRHRYGLVQGMSVRENVSMACLDRLARMGVVDQSKERKLADGYVRDLNIITPSVETAAKNLSGGNQQKVIVSKWLATTPRMLILDEPTRGVDVGAKVEIFNILNRLVCEGMAILFISSELPEIMGMSDRILVMHEGRLTGEFVGGQCTEEQIMRSATGGE